MKALKTDDRTMDFLKPDRNMEEEYKTIITFAFWTRDDKEGDEEGAIITRTHPPANTEGKMKVFLL